MNSFYVDDILGCHLNYTNSQKQTSKKPLQLGPSSLFATLQEVQYSLIGREEMGISSALSIFIDTCSKHTDECKILELKFDLQSFCDL